jgi:Omp85 superfamily domain
MIMLAFTLAIYAGAVEGGAAAAAPSAAAAAPSAAAAAPNAATAAPNAAAAAPSAAALAPGAAAPGDAVPAVPATAAAASVPSAPMTPAAAAPAKPPPPAAPSAAKPQGLSRWLDPANAPFIPIPEIDTDPQSGLTLGLLAVMLSTNERDEITRIIAPDIIDSQYFGWGARMRVFGYPSEDTQWSVVGGGKERVEREFDAIYLDGQTRTEAFSWSVETIYDRSGTPRFFGIGNQSSFANQTTYVDNQGSVAVSVGRNFTPALQLSYIARLRDVDILPGVLSGVPSIETRFPGLPGIGNEHELQNTLELTRDTRDSALIPQSGGRYVLYGGLVSQALASSVSYSYFGAEARQYFRLGSDLTLACHLAARYMPSAAEAPFWALSSLGGDRSVTNEREPLRSEGADRYMDRDLFAGGAELRTRLTSLDAFGTHVNLELAPFLDAGKVFADMGASPLTHLHTAPGFGVRGVASPFIVGYVDVGFGHGQPVFFSGINYPF